MIFSESNANISAALARAWSAIQTPKYNAKVKVSTKQGGAYTFEYTDLNGILEAVRPIFIENQLFITQNAYSVLENNVTMACVETTFLHGSGEYVKSYPLKFPAAQKMQDFGGQITYMKRYSLAAMLGIATEKDDDANGASGNSYQYQKQPQSSPPSQQQVQQPQQSIQNQQAPQQRQTQQPPYPNGTNNNLATTEQLQSLNMVLNQAATRTKTDKTAVAEYAKIQLQIPAEVKSSLLTRQQANAMIAFIKAIPPAE